MISMMFDKKKSIHLNFKIGRISPPTSVSLLILTAKYKLIKINKSSYQTSNNVLTKFENIRL